MPYKPTRRTPFFRFSKTLVHLYNSAGGRHSFDPGYSLLSARINDRCNKRSLFVDGVARRDMQNRQRRNAGRRQLLRSAPSKLSAQDYGVKLFHAK